MKKTLLILGIICWIFIGCKAMKTDDPPQPARFGAKAGANFSSVNGDDAESFSGKTGFHFGGMVEIPVSDKFAVQPELLYSSQGADYSENEFTGSYKLDYLTIPVMAKFSLGEGFSVQAGPQVGFLLSAKDEYEIDGETMKEDVKDFTKSTDIGANIGVDYTFDSGLNIGARYNMGISRLDDFSGEEATNTKWRNSVFQISLGYLFN